MNVTAANLKKGDVAVCISHSGNTKVTIDAMNYALEAGATTIGITSFLNSVVTDKCDYSIIAFSDEQKYHAEAISARIVHFCIIDAIMMTLAAMKHNSYTEHIITRNKILQSIRY